MLREFCNYFISVMLGRRDSLSSFLEPLTMGEKYLHWGMESKDIRDFRAAMDYLHLCYDRDAPMATLLIRKYNCISDVSGAAVETLLQKHQRVIEAAVKTESRYREELGTITKKIEDLKIYIRKLRDEGSLIKARNEESHLRELEDNGGSLREKLESGEGRTDIFDSYDEITSDAIRFFRELDHASTVVLANVMLGPQKSESIASHLRSRLDFLRERLEKADPIRDRASEPGNNSAPARMAGVKKAGG
jgi:hypothetical protein